MYYAYINEKVVAYAHTEDTLAKLCAKVGHTDYTISQEPPRYEPPFDLLKKQKLRAVNAWTEKKITGGFVSEGITYDSDKDTQLTMQGIALNVNTPLFAEKYPDGCPVRGYAEGATEKTIFMLTAEEVLKWCADLSLHIGKCKQEGWAKQAEVNACTTKEELNGIVLEEKTNA